MNQLGVDQILELTTEEQTAEGQEQSEALYYNALASQGEGKTITKVMRQLGGEQ